MYTCVWVYAPKAINNMYALSTLFLILINLVRHLYRIWGNLYRIKILWTTSVFHSGGKFCVKPLQSFIMQFKNVLGWTFHEDDWISEFRISFPSHNLPRRSTFALWLRTCYYCMYLWMLLLALVSDNAGTRRFATQYSHECNSKVWHCIKCIATVAISNYFRAKEKQDGVIPYVYALYI